MRKFFRGFLFAFEGLFAAIKSEINVKFHLFAMLLVSIAGYYFSINIQEWIAIVLCFGIILSAELMNTAVEKLSDIMNPQQSEKIKLVKDISAAAVLIVAIAVAVVGLIIFLPYCVSLFKS
jgi:diacylglycerol kinase (ATP)